jgi:hypothetical protein
MIRPPPKRHKPVWLSLSIYKTPLDFGRCMFVIYHQILLLGQEGGRWGWQRRAVRHAASLALVLHLQKHGWCSCCASRLATRLLPSSPLELSNVCPAPTVCLSSTRDTITSFAPLQDTRVSSRKRVI